MVNYKIALNDIIIFHVQFFIKLPRILKFYLTQRMAFKKGI